MTSLHQLQNPNYVTPLKNTYARPIVVTFKNGKQVLVQPNQKLDDSYRQSFGEIRGIKFKDD